MGTPTLRGWRDDDIAEEADTILVAGVEREREDVGRPLLPHLCDIQGGELAVVGEDQPERGGLRRPCRLERRDLVDQRALVVRLEEFQLRHRAEYFQRFCCHFRTGAVAGEQEEIVGCHGCPFGSAGFVMAGMTRKDCRHDC